MILCINKGRCNVGIRYELFKKRRCNYISLVLGVYLLRVNREKERINDKN
jgi:hypothetical protein